MDQKLVRLRVPAAGLDMDALVPCRLPIRQVTALLAEAAVQASRGLYRPTGEELLCCERLSRVLAPGAVLDSYDIVRGDELVLV